MFETIILPAMSLGLSAASIPGPFQAYLLDVTLKYGWKRGLLVILSPLIVDSPIILLTVFILQAIPAWAIQAIRVGGGLLLLWIAWGAWQQLRSGAEFSVDTKTKAKISPQRILLTAMAMNALSPGPYLFWSTVNGPLLLEALQISSLAALGMLLGFYGVFLGGMVFLVFFFHRLGKIGSGFTAYLLVATIALLLWFASQLILLDVLALVWLHQLITGLIIVDVIVYIFLNWRKNNKLKNAQILD